MKKINSNKPERSTVDVGGNKRITSIKNLMKKLKWRRNDSLMH